MKKSLFILALLLVSITYGQQKKTYKIVGNEIVAVQAEKKTAEPVKTGLTHKIKDTVYPVYKSARGSYYIIRTSKKTGNQYKQYLKLENQ